MDWPYRRALVTGGAGFIGSHLVEALLGLGSEVVVMDNLSTGRMENLAAVLSRIDFHRGDICDETALKSAAGGCDVVFHLAAVVSVVQTVETPVASALVNELGTLRVLEAARQAGAVRAVLSSSSAVYGNDAQVPNRESMMPRPMSPYAVQKLTGELYAGLYNDLYGMETVCLRYFNVYGPRQDPSSPYSGVISIFMDRAISGTPPVIYGDGGQCRDFVYVQDVVAANLLAATGSGAAGGVFNIGTGQAVEVKDLWEKIQIVTGSDRSPGFESARLGEIYASVADVGLAAERLGYVPAFGFDRGLAETYDWYRSLDCG
ncbi:MAG: NAD-dependent epimerase/dehydratase family protein [Desulfobacterales bacterium]|nr:NAD-dependent epimerase/dehydratase family protein [Desulfobacterales bacterium]